MKYWVLPVSMFILGCGGGDSGSGTAENSAETVGEEVADALNEAQDAAEAVGDLLKEEKDALDEALEEATGD